MNFTKQEPNPALYLVLVWFVINHQKSTRYVLYPKFFQNVIRVFSCAVLLIQTILAMNLGVSLEILRPSRVTQNKRKSVLRIVRVGEHKNIPSMKPDTAIGLPSHGVEIGTKRLMYLSFHSGGCLVRKWDPIKPPMLWETSVTLRPESLASCSTNFARLVK